MPPFDDLKVRQAMNYAIDKHKIVRLLHGMVTPANGFLPPVMPGFNPNRTAYPYDPSKARQLLAAAGHANGFSCKLWFEAGNVLIGPAAASAIQFDLARVGIAAQLNPVAFAPLLASMERRKTVQCGLMGWSQDYPDPSDFLDFNFNGERITEEGCQNLSFYNRPEVNILLAKAAKCGDPDRRLRSTKPRNKSWWTTLPACLSITPMPMRCGSRGSTASIFTPFGSSASSGCGWIDEEEAIQPCDLDRRTYTNQKLHL